MAIKKQAGLESLDEYEFMVVKSCHPADGSEAVIVAGEVGTPDDELEPLVINEGNQQSLEITARTSPVYDHIVIWAEESGGMINGESQWSYGNGASGNIGVDIVGDWELYAISYHADDANADANITVDVVDYQPTTPSLLVNVDLPNAGQFDNYSSNTQVDPVIPVTDGMVLGFRTGTETNVINDARVAAWLRRKTADAITEILVDGNPITLNP